MKTKTFYNKIFVSESRADCGEGGNERERESAYTNITDTHQEEMRKLVILAFRIFISLQIICDSCALVEELRA